MPAASAVIAFPTSACQQSKTAEVAAPVIILADLSRSRIASARADIKSARDALASASSPAELVVLVERLRGSLFDMLRLHGSSRRHWAELQAAELADLAVMRPSELEGLVVRLASALATHTD